MNGETSIPSMVRRLDSYIFLTLIGVYLCQSAAKFQTQDSSC
jgi:hypothetical protein